MLTAPRSLILNAVLFQVGWFACIFGARHPWLLAVALACLVAHFLWVASWRTEGRLVASVTLFGCALDSFLLNLGVFDFVGDSPLLPVWLALLWAPLLPWNKQLWTSSYVLWTGGWAMLALAAAHLLVDRRGWPALGHSFGVNAIAAYAGSAVMVYAFAGLGWWGPIYQVGFAGWMTPRFGPYLPSLAFALAFVGFWWLVVRWMDRRGWHLKI